MQIERRPDFFYPMKTALKDTTMLRLLVDYSGDEDHGQLEDETVSWTIGFNSFDHTGIDEWEFVGWSWSQDIYTNGKGTPIGWLPFHFGGLDLLNFHRGDNYEAGLYSRRNIEAFAEDQKNPETAFTDV